MHVFTPCARHLCSLWVARAMSMLSVAHKHTQPCRRICRCTVLCMPAHRLRWPRTLGDARAARTMSVPREWPTKDSAASGRCCPPCGDGAPSVASFSHTSSARRSPMACRLSCVLPCTGTGGGGMRGRGRWGGGRAHNYTKCGNQLALSRQAAFVLALPGGRGQGDKAYECLQRMA